MNARRMALLPLLLLAGCLPLQPPDSQSGAPGEPPVAATPGDAPAPTTRVVTGPPLAEGMKPASRTLQPAPGAFYRVRPGDTLWAIASAHNLDVEQLASLNRITRPNQLLVGQRLRIRPETADTGDANGPITERNAKSVASGKKSETQAALKPPPPPDTLDPEQEERAAERDRTAPARNAQSLSKLAPKGWIWPHAGRIIARFGQFGAHRSTGIDLSARPGDPVVAAADGVVAYADSGLSGYGNTILLRHSGSFMTAYGHLQSILVKRGESVSAGQTIGLAGQSGATPSPRLHFEIRHNINPLNPIEYLPAHPNHASETP